MEKKNKNLAGCIILNKKNEVLLQKKTLDYKTKYRGCWCIFGGEVKKGESPKEAAEREIKEEINCEISNINPFYIKDYKLENGRYGKLYVFTGFFNGNISQISLHEGAGFAFFSASELTSIKIMEMNLNALKKYFKI